MRRIVFEFDETYLSDLERDTAKMRIVGFSTSVDKETGKGSGVLFVSNRKEADASELAFFISTLAAEQARIASLLGEHLR